MDGVVFLPSFYEAIQHFPDAERLEVYDAIMRYGLYGEIVDLSPVVRPVFTLIKPVIDSSQRRYQAAKDNGNKPPKEGSNPRGRPRKNQTVNQSEKQKGKQPGYQEKDLEKEKDFDLESEKNDSDFERKTDVFSFPETYKPLSADEDAKRRRVWSETLSRYDVRP